MPEYSKIAKNAGFLFVRMIVIMVISLYTSRLVLEVLGVDNYGVYGVVGGLVAMVSYINQALSSSTLRFITVSIGRDDKSKVKETFNTCIAVHGGLALVILILAETIGLWFFYNKLVIPQGSQDAAFVIYQLSVLSTMITIFTLPFNSIIIAHERMSAFAYISFVDTLLKLGIVGLLIILPFDKLIVYGILLFFTQIIYSTIYIIYCYRNFPESHLSLNIDKKEAGSIIKFAGWSLFGCTAYITYTQGLNILLNIFGGAVLNAARGLAVQVQATVTNFVANFQTAINPQIMKSYASGSLNDMHLLIYMSSKYSYFLIFILSAPLFINMELVLGWWLKTVPAYLPIFLKIILIITLIDSLSNAIMKSVDATGRIKRYHVIVGCLLMLILPFGYLALKLGLPYYSIFIVQAIFSVIALFVRLIIVKGLISINVGSFSKHVVLPVSEVTLLSVMVITLLSGMHITNSLIHFLVSSSVVTIINLVVIWYVGMSLAERIMISAKIKLLVSRFKKL